MPTHLQYIAYFTKTPPKIDGLLDEAVWEEVGWSPDFVDIQGNDRVPNPPRFDTRFKMRWDAKFLYVGAYLQVFECVCVCVCA